MPHGIGFAVLLALTTVVWAQVPDAATKVGTASAAGARHRMANCRYPAACAPCTECEVTVSFVWYQI